jgi:hypothetical protein
MVFRGLSSHDKQNLFRLLLLLLTDAHLNVQRLGFLETFMIVARNCVRQILVDVGRLGQDHHQSEIVIAGWAEGPEPLYIRNCHNF